VNGRVVVSGGFYYPLGTLSSAEIYEPAVGN